MANSKNLVFSIGVSFLPLVILYLGVLGFTPTAEKTLFRRNLNHLRMVRNVDLPECVVFYGLPDSFLGREEDSALLSLLQECHETDTAVVVIPDSSSYNNSNDTINELPFYSHWPPAKAYYHRPKSNAPNPIDLYDALNSLSIRPRPFGGSSGFGVNQYAEPERVPLASRTVVLCQTLAQTRAARFCGMRVLCFTDNDLADAVIDGIDFYLDDIATPGSFWLNPPSPRDDLGNRVDIFELIDYYNAVDSNINEVQQNSNDEIPLADGASAENLKDISEDDIQRILADLAPLA